MCLNRTTGTGGVATDLIRSTTAEDLDLKFYVQTPFELEEYDGGPLVSDPVPDNGHNPVNDNRATSTEPQTACTLGVLCLDYGAYGTLTARIPAGVAALNGAEARFIQNPANLTVAQLLSATPTMRLPKDDDANLIADGWEHNAGGTADAAEAQPVGLGVHGDGFSRYDEYRGFAHNGQHLRTDPDGIKDVFIAKGQLAEFDGHTGPPLDFSLLGQLGYAIHDQLLANEWEAEGMMAVLRVFQGTAAGRNRYAIAAIRTWDCLGDTRFGQACPVAGSLEDGMYILVNYSLIETHHLGAPHMRYVCAHEVGHVLWLRPASAGNYGSGHRPLKGCVMDYAMYNVDPQSVFCSQPGPATDPACTLSHSALRP